MQVIITEEHSQPHLYQEDSAKLFAFGIKLNFKAIL